jgi:hypothetical protein
MVFSNGIAAGEDEAQIVAGVEADPCQLAVKVVHVKKSGGQAG